MKQGLAGDTSDREGTMDGIGKRNFARRALVLVATAAALAGIAVPGASGAEAERELDPLLSLIGGCSLKVEPLDPVEDPGCPTTLPEGPHPPEKFAGPDAVTTDFYGNIYVSNFGKLETGSQGRIDIFTPNGGFISELKRTGAKAVAVDSNGVLYVVANVEGEKLIFRYTPTVYEPAAAKVEYGSPPTQLPIGSNALSIQTGLAINPSNDHLFANFGAGGVVEFDSAEAGSAAIRTTFTGIWPYGVGVAVNANRHLLYATAVDDRIDIFDLNQVVGSPPNDEYKKVGSIEGSATPEGNFVGYLSVAVDEATGNVYVLDGEASRMYEFDEDGIYLATIEHGFSTVLGAEIGVDNGPFSPNGKLSDNGHYLYVPSGKTGTGHSFAFEESSFGPPVVSGVTSAGVTESEAELLATINPGNLETKYTFEYTTQQSFEAEGFAGALIAGSGKLPAGNLDAEASAVATGLQEGTAYRFRILASNEEGSDEAEGSFATYPDPAIDLSSCANALLRIGPSALLPDCRAYELVTPPDTNGRSPVGTGHESQFTNRQVSPDGNKLPFKVEGGSLGGSDVTGSYLGDPYLSTRGVNGWGTDPIGPTGAEAQSVIPGGTSPDQGYSFWTAESGGTATDEGKPVTYVRYPDGHSEVLGKGSIGTYREAAGKLISEGGGHIIFLTDAIRERQKITLGQGTTGGTFTLSFEGQSTGSIPYNCSAAELETALAALPDIGPEAISVTGSNGGPFTAEFIGSLSGLDVPPLGADASGLIVLSGEGQIAIATVQPGGGRLEPSASRTGTTIYDRTLDGITHVVSLLPGDVSPNITSVDRGASLDGEGVAFSVGTKLYLRYQDSETFEIGDGVEFAGIAEGGNRIFYVQGSQLWRFDAKTQARTPFSSGTVTPVNISEDGTAAYYVSTQVLTTEPNPVGAKAQAGKENLYLSREGAISFVGILTKTDVIGEPGKVLQIEGLGLWVTAVNDDGSLGRDPSRSTPDGSTLIFRARAALTGYDPQGIPQIYRYNFTSDELQCLSCNPTGASPSAAATLQSESREGFALFYYQAWIRNLRPDGRRAFFESPEALVPGDTDGKLDVYEWEAQGVGSCTHPEGCVHLTSSPHSLRDEYLWAVSESGDDAFFISSDRILPRDSDETPSIYDARVNGGFPEPATAECQGEGCRPQLSPPPALPAVQTPVQGAGDNYKSPRRCPKGKRKVKRGGKVQCVKKKQEHRAGSNRKGAHK